MNKPPARPRRKQTPATGAVAAPVAPAAQTLAPVAVVTADHGVAAEADAVVDAQNGVNKAEALSRAAPIVLSETVSAEASTDASLIAADPAPEPLVEPAVPVDVTPAEAPSAEAAPKVAATSTFSQTSPFLTSPLFMPKEFFMSNLPAFDFVGPFQSMFADFQEKAKAAFEKSTGMIGDYSEFAKGNMEAMVESSRILASGLQELTTSMVSDSRAGFESLTAEVKELAAAKSPTDFLKLQNDIAKKHFDEAVAHASKGSEALMKLASEAVQPISTRVSLAVEKVKAAA